MLTLKPITPDYYDAALELGVSPEDEQFVAPIVKSLADAYVYKDALFRIACEADRPVGYVLIYPFDQDRARVVNIVRIMIDQRYQGRGLGRGLLAETIQWIQTLSPRADRIRISTLPDNERALRLYRSAGFEGDDLESGEIALYLLNPGSRSSQDRP